jgi:two-component system KDP operon response regulator KdpE
LGRHEELIWMDSEPVPSSGPSDPGPPGNAAERSATPALRFIVLVPDASMDLERLTTRLRAGSFTPIVLSRAEQLPRLLASWRPRAAVVGGGIRGLDPILRSFENAAVPVVFIGDADQILLAGSVGTIEVGILAPSDAHEIVSALRVVTSSAPDGLQVRQRGALRINTAQRTVWIDDRLLELPPREFALLAELARHSNEPIPAAELARRAWPDDAYTTREDVHRAIYRLRSLIGDRERSPPIIQNRRGFGYVLRATPPGG